MKIRAAIIDFDGTITTRDMVDLLAQLAGRETESAALDQKFRNNELTGLEGLIQRINFLSGITKSDIHRLIENEDYIRPGAYELFEYFKTNGIISIIASGNIMPLLEVYRAKLGATYVICSHPKMDGETIESISENDYSGPNFKYDGVKEILESLGIAGDSVVAIGDSPADISLFKLAALSIAVEPKAKVEEYADFVVQHNLAEIIPILGRCQDTTC